MKNQNDLRDTRVFTISSTLGRDPAQSHSNTLMIKYLIESANRFVLPSLFVRSARQRRALPPLLPRDPALPLPLCRSPRRRFASRWRRLPLLRRFFYRPPPPRPPLDPRPPRSVAASDPLRRLPCPRPQTRRSAHLAARGAGPAVGRAAPPGSSAAPASVRGQGTRMSALVPAAESSPLWGWERIRALVLASVSSLHSRRAYAHGAR
jgi:hypothetical protein